MLADEVRSRDERRHAVPCSASVPASFIKGEHDKSRMYLVADTKCSNIHFPRS